ncbi:MAG: DUF4276 family protein [Planctomycetes bacterium]|nr:DUF4276 family protein [Planctomycetota bacterium]
MNIQPIVEGYGDVKAVPTLLRRLLDQAKIYDVKIARPIRWKQSQLLNEDGLRKAVRLAGKQTDCAAIVILFEHEDGCPKKVGPLLLRWAQSETSLPCGVVLAHREFEAWFLAAVESLRGKCDIRENAQPPDDPESVRGAKEAIAQFMPKHRIYRETTDQDNLAAVFDMRIAFQKCRSFKHMVKTFGAIVAGLGKSVANWPPSDWLQSRS